VDQVVCIRDDWGHKPNLKAWPIVGSVYTVRERLVIKAVYSQPPMVFYHLEEIINPLVLCSGGPTCRNGFTEPVFEAAWFRPVKHTDISVFEKVLRPRDVEVV
jgi:hypothetical protein